MSIKPLDLQVNINATLHVGKEEAERIAKGTEQQREIDMKAIKEAQKRSEQVNKSESSEGGQKLKDTESHFGLKTLPEQEAEIYEKEKRKKEKKQKDKETEKKVSKEKEPEGISDGHINFLA
ncbi:MAG: hypothetical protein OEZ13_09635 [Spirochaetia bacterium]|nr:hypothetical protein [Spirochaetia bacterium]